MPSITCTQVEIYVFRRRRTGAEFLVLRRAPHRSLPGVWQPVTGGIRAREPAARAALRELREETGLRPRRFWGLETMTTFFEAATDRVRVVALFAAEIGVRDAVQLSHEHDTFRFLPAARAKPLVLWDAQRRGFDCVRREVLANAALARALEIPLRRR